MNSGASNGSAVSLIKSFWAAEKSSMDSGTEKSLKM